MVLKARLEIANNPGTQPLVTAVAELLVAHLQVQNAMLADTTRGTAQLYTIFVALLGTNVTHSSHSESAAESKICAAAQTRRAFQKWSL